MVSLTGIYNYPLKSCSANSHEKLSLDHRGLEDDRRMALVSPDGHLVTARTYPLIAGIKVVTMNDQQLSIVHEGITHHFELEPQDNIELHHFDKTFKGTVISSVANEFFTDLLGIKCTLTCNNRMEPRVLNPKYGKDNWEVRMVDSSPLLLVNQASVDALNQKLNKPVDPLCFRPNVIIKGLLAQAELGLKRIRIGAIDFEVNTSCKRCRLTTLDADSLKYRPDGEPLKTLSTYSKTESGAVEFGVYLLPLNKGILQVGDKVIY